MLNDKKIDSNWAVSVYDEDHNFFKKMLKQQGT